MIVRAETPADVPAVRRMVAAAFGRAAEADLVAALQQSGDAAISLVADDAGDIVGHILFSRLKAPRDCLALAPVSVAPHRQGQGIGSMLVRDGLARARDAGWQTVLVLGKPGYYGRFGFTAAAADRFETEYPKAYFLALDLVPRAAGELSGKAVYPEPFDALE